MLTKVPENSIKKSNSCLSRSVINTVCDQRSTDLLATSSSDFKQAHRLRTDKWASNDTTSPSSASNLLRLNDASDGEDEDRKEGLRVDPKGIVEEEDAIDDEKGRHSRRRAWSPLLEISWLAFQVDGAMHHIEVQERGVQASNTDWLELRAKVAWRRSGSDGPSHRR